MLPVVRGERETRRQILLYTILLVAVTVLPFAGRLFDGLYLAAALGLGARVHRLRAHPPASRRPSLGAPHLPLLARIPRAAVRRDGGRRPAVAPRPPRSGLAIGGASAYGCACIDVPPRRRRPPRRARMPRVRSRPRARPGATGGHRPDFAYNVLPPGQFGGVPIDPNSTDQLPLYDGADPPPRERDRGRHPQVLQAARTSADRRRPPRSRRDGPVSRSCATASACPTSTGRRARTPGSAPAMRTAPGPGAAPVPGPRARSRRGGRGSGRERLRARHQRALVRPERPGRATRHGPEAEARGRLRRQGRQILRDLQAYADGINAAFEDMDVATPPWTVNDTIAVTAFIGSIFGNGGGAETRNADFLAKLRGQPRRRRRVQARSWTSWRPTTTTPPPPRSAASSTGSRAARPPPGSPLIDPGSSQELSATPSQARRRTS